MCLRPRRWSDSSGLPPKVASDTGAVAETGWLRGRGWSALRPDSAAGAAPWRAERRGHRCLR